MERCSSLPVMMKELFESFRVLPEEYYEIKIFEKSILFSLQEQITRVYINSAEP